MWQSQIEIEYYFITYFKCITEFPHNSAKLLLGAGLIVLRGCIRYSCIYIACMSPTLSRSSPL